MVCMELMSFIRGFIIFFDWALFFVSVTDKMNFDSINKLTAPCITDILANIDNVNATRQILMITRKIIDSFLDKSLSPVSRIYKIWYCVFFNRLWRYWIKVNGHSLLENFLTLNVFLCIEINAHSILVLIEKCRKFGTMEYFTPWLFSSQPTEKIFRQTRSMTTTNSTIVNYDIAEMMDRLARIKTINAITSDIGNLINSFVFLG